MSASRAGLISLAVYLSVTLAAPILRGTVSGPLADHALIVLGASALALPLLLRR